MEADARVTTVDLIELNDQPRPRTSSSPPDLIALKQAQQQERERAERERAERIARKTLVIRQATPDELERFRADRERYLAGSQDSTVRQESLRVAAKLRGEQPPRKRGPQPAGVCARDGCDQDAGGWGRYCSRSCATLASRPELPPLPPRACLTCGATFVPKSPAGRYCNKRCTRRSRSAKQRAEQ